MPDDAPGTEAPAEVADAPTVDVALYEAKIAELTATVADLTAQVAAKDAEIVAAKAANYDLLTSVPVPEVDAGDQISPDVDEDIDVADLFGDKE